MSPPCALLALLVAASPAASAPQKRSASDPEVRKLVEYVIKVPTGELAPQTIPPFLEVDPATLPDELKGKWWAKKEELFALQKIAGGKKKAPLRRIAMEAKAKCTQEEASDQQLKIMKMAGFDRILESELLELMNKTNCSECELQEEFTLRVFQLVPGKDGKLKMGGKEEKAEKPKEAKTAPAGKADKPKMAYMLHETDPIWTVIATIRQGGQASAGTNFFGIGGHPKCR